MSDGRYTVVVDEAFEQAAYGHLKGLNIGIGGIYYPLSPGSPAIFDEAIANATNGNQKKEVAIEIIDGRSVPTSDSEGGTSEEKEGEDGVEDDP